MEFAYFGYRSWAEDILKDLKESGFDIDSFTIPKNEYSFIEELNTNIRKSIEITNGDFSKYRALFFYGWSWIVPENIVNNNETVCLHPSPLPKYRGGSPIQHQIINGEKVSAVTLFKMDSGIDTGPIYYRKPFSLEGSLNDIFERISKIGSNLTKKLIHDFETGKTHLTPQKEDEATFFKRRRPSESELTPDMLRKMTSKEIYDFIRALEDPYPNAYIVGKDGGKVFLKKAEKN